MPAEFDAARLAELQDLLGTDLDAIVATLVRELSQAIDAVADGLAARDLDAVSRAAHAARNSALMIDAGPLLERLAALESAARRADMAAALEAQAQLAAAWPGLRRRLERAPGGR